MTYIIPSPEGAKHPRASVFWCKLLYNSTVSMVTDAIL